MQTKNQIAPPREKNPTPTPGSWLCRALGLELRRLYVIVALLLLHCCINVVAFIIVIMVVVIAVTMLVNAGTLRMCHRCLHGTISQKTSCTHLVYQPTLFFLQLIPVHPTTSAISDSAIAYATWRCMQRAHFRNNSTIPSVPSCYISASNGNSADSIRCAMGTLNAQRAPRVCDARCAGAAWMMNLECLAGLARNTRASHGR